MSGYEPYINDAHARIDHMFVPGVNVVVGINGLGKTTLLNIVFRMLIGPWEPSKADKDRPGRKQASLTRTNNFNFFARRANDQAVDAVASATFLFGTRSLRITRSLTNLGLVGYALDGHEKLAALDPIGRDEELMDTLAMLMNFDVAGAKARGMDNYRYDFDFVVRNLIFFPESKVPLIWNPDGQFVILRILLVDQALSERIAKTRNDLLQADSQYRNKLWASNRLRADIADSLAELTIHTADTERFQLAVSEVSGLQQRRDDLLQERTDLNERIDRIENDLLRARAEAFDVQHALRHEEAAFFQQAFISVRSPGDVILQALAGKDGCLVCGSKEPHAHDRARALIEAHQCPVCESETGQSEEGVVPFGDAVLQRLRASERTASDSLRRVSNLEKAATEASEAFRAIAEELEKTVMSLGRARREERAAELVAAQTQEAQAKQRELAALDEEVAQLRAALKAFVVRHEELIVESKEFIEQRKNAIIETFERYASAFMVEDCRLRYRSDRRARVAQSDDQIDWPAFEVDLASGADASPTERREATEVSESQKEFIDLAFRMALLRVASDGEESMLVVETPEASLDAFFVEKAGRLLREYANDNPGNVLLVSSNLTREEMIARLLGTPERLENPEGRRRRTLNLLEYARPTKAYRLNQKFYDERYAAAIEGDPMPSPEPTVG